MDDGTATGWRARKREQTARRIAEAGYRLMMERGYDDTTLDAIAEAADISRRTFFHYYASKEDILLAWQDGLARRFNELLDTLPARATPLSLLEAAQTALVADYDSDRTRILDTVIRGSDRLHAANQAKYLMLERVAWKALCRRWPDPARSAQLRAAAMAGAGAMRLAFEGWVTDPDRQTLKAHIRATYAALVGELCDAT